MTPYMMLVMRLRTCAAIIVTVPIIVLAVIVGGWAGVILAAMFGAILIAITLEGN